MPHPLGSDDRDELAGADVEVRGRRARRQATAVVGAGERDVEAADPEARRAPAVAGAGHELAAFGRKSFV